ncbi:MAG: hypothetical protein AB2693_26910, partial [Candidatus Thiodiazotropha sp.]
AFIAHSLSHMLSFLLPLIQEGQLSVTGESRCTLYWCLSLLMNRVVRLTDRLDMTLAIGRDVKQQINLINFVIPTCPDIMAPQYLNQHTHRSR